MRGRPDRPTPWRLRLYASFLSLANGVRAEDSGDEFSNNLLSDLSPLLALFGEQFAKQFMSHSLTIADNVVFAMAPIGVITALVGAIRAGGPAWLRSVIGRARENHAAAEVEYMSSVSHEVCEVWNGSSVVRIPGSPEIQMFVYIKELQHETIACSPGVPAIRTFGIHTLEEDNVEKTLTIGTYGIDFVWSKAFRQKSGTDSENARPSRYKVIDHHDKLASNITLNLARSRVWLLYASAVFGVALQAGVLVVSGLATYRFPWLKGGSEVSWYAYPFTAAGTTCLCLGMFICATVIEQSTREFRWKPADTTQKLHVLWLQRELVINDQSFRSFGLFSQRTLDFLLTSHPVHLLETPEGTMDSKDKNAVRREYMRRLNSYTIVGTVVSLVGFVFQFVGLRAMHWSASIFQLGATLIMILVRVALRWKLTSEPNAVELMKGHELDWFARGHEGGRFWEKHVLELEQGDPLTVERTTSSSQDTLSSQKKDTDPSPTRFGCSRWTVATGGSYQRCSLAFRGTATEITQSAADPLAPKVPGTKRHDNTAGLRRDSIRDFVPSDTVAKAETTSTVKSATETGDTRHNSSRAQDILDIRKRLQILSKWKGRANAAANTLAACIEEVLNGTELLRLPDGMLEMDWTLDAELFRESKMTPRFGKSLGLEGIRITASRRAQTANTWKVDETALNSVLSLWIESAVVSKRSTEHHTEPDQDNFDMAQKGLLFLGESNQASCRDLIWWLSDAIHTEIQEVPGNAENQSNTIIDRQGEKTIEFDRSRVVGYRSGEKLEADRVTVLNGPEGFRPLPPLLQKAESHRPGSSIAWLTVTPLIELYVKHMFMSFMWAVAPHFDLDQGTKILSVQPFRAGNISIESVWNSLRLENLSLSGLALRLSALGLGKTSDDVLVLLVPPLSCQNKLVPPRKLLQQMHRDAAHALTCEQWSDAGDIYLSLNTICTTFGETHELAVIAYTLLMSFGDIASDSLMHKMVKSPDESAEVVILKKIGDARREIDQNAPSHVGLSILKLQLGVQGGIPGWLKYWDVVAQGEMAGLVAPRVESDIEQLSQLLKWNRVHAFVACSRYIDSEAFVGNAMQLAREMDILGRTAFHYAAMEGRWGRIKLLNLEKLVLSTDLDLPDLFGWTPYHYLCWYHVHEWDGDTLPVENPGQPANKDAVDFYGKTPLLLASEGGNLAMVKDLLANFQVKASIRSHHGNALHLSAKGTHFFDPFHKQAVKDFCPCNLDIIGTLLQYGFNCDVRSENGVTAFLVCARNVNSNALSFLAERGFSGHIMDRDSHNMSCLHMAAIAGVPFLIETILNIAKSHGLDSQELCNFKDDTLQSALHLASKLDDAENVTLLVKEGARLEDRNQEGHTPLHCAVVENAQKAAKAMLRMDGDWLSQLDHRGRTPLHCAARAGHLGMVILLIGTWKFRAGARISIDSPRTAQRLIDYLRAKGLWLSVVNSLQDYAQEQQVQQRERQKLLSFFDDYENASDHFRHLEDFTDKGMAYWMAQRDEDGQTPLHLAAQHGYFDIAEYLIQSLDGAPAATFHSTIVDLLSEKDNHGRTALHLASIHGKVPVIRVLLKYGATVNISDSEQLHPLFYAVAAGHKTVTDLLLKNGAQMTVENRERALKYAVSLEDTSLLRMLWGSDGLKGAGSLAIQKSDRLRAVYHAAERGSEAAMSFLLNQPEVVSFLGTVEEFVQTPLDLAIAREVSSTPIIKLLLEADESGRLRDSTKADPSLRSTPLIRSILGRNFEAASCLLDFHADVKLKDIHGVSPLYAACLTGARDLVMRIADQAGWNGLNDRVSDPSRPQCVTALHAAISNGHMSLASELLQHAGVYQEVRKNDQEQTPLDMAICSGTQSKIETESFVLDYVLPKWSNSAQEINRFVRCKSFPGPTSKLFHAVFHGYSDKLFDSFLQLGATPGETGHKPGETVLHFITKIVHPPSDIDIQSPAAVPEPCSAVVSSPDRGTAMLEILLRHCRNQTTTLPSTGGKGNKKCIIDCKINAKDSDGDAAIHFAIRRRCLLAVNMLLDNGARADLQDGAGVFPFQLAIGLGEEAMARSILDKHDQGEVVLNSLLPYGLSVGESCYPDILGFDSPHHSPIPNFQTLTYSPPYLINHETVPRLNLANDAENDAEPLESNTAPEISRHVVTIIEPVPLLRPQVQLVPPFNRKGSHLAATSARPHHLDRLPSPGLEFAVVEDRSIDPTPRSPRLIEDPHIPHDRDLPPQPALKESIPVRLAPLRTALQEAAARLSADFVRFLIEKGATGDQLDGDGNSALVLSLSPGRLKGENPGEIAVILLSECAKIDFESPEGKPATASQKPGRTPLYIASEAGLADVVSSLIDKGAPLCFPSSNSSVQSFLPLVIASMHGFTDITTALLDAASSEGSDWKSKVINYRDSEYEDNTALHAAVLNQNSEITNKLLGEGANPNAVNRNASTPLHLACYFGNYSTVQLLITFPGSSSILTRDIKGRLPLHYAAERGNNPAVLEALLQNSSRGFDWPDNAGELPVHLACRYAQANVVKFLFGYAEQHNIPPSFASTPNNELWTPLHFAAKSGDENIVHELLMRVGAEAVNACTLEGETALIIAGIGRRKAVINRMVRFLNTGIQNNPGPFQGNMQSAVLYSAIHKLLEWGVGRNEPSRESTLNWTIDATIGFNVEYFRHFHHLYMALRRGLMDFFQFLVEGLAHDDEELKLPATTMHGERTLQLRKAPSAYGGYLVRSMVARAGPASRFHFVHSESQVRRGAPLEVLKLLCDRNVFTPDSELEDGHAVTILHVAAAMGRERAVRLLQPLSQEAMKLYRNLPFYSTPLHLAVVCGHLSCASTIIEWQDSEPLLSDLPDMHGWTIRGYITACYLDGVNASQWRKILDKVRRCNADALHNGNQVGSLLPPGGWSTFHRAKEFQVGPSGVDLYLDLRIATNGTQRLFSIMADHPIPYNQREYYFEVSLRSTGYGCTTVIGLSNGYESTFDLPGFCTHSVGIESLGALYANGSYVECGSSYHFRQGDTVGLGLSEGFLYFTRNGFFIDKLDIPFLISGKLFPSFGFSTLRCSPHDPNRPLTPRMHVVANFGRDEQVPFLFDPRHPDHLSVIRNAIPIVKEADETEVDKIIGQAKANSRLLLTWYDQPADSRAEHISKREAGADEAENAKVSHVYARTYNRQPPGAEVTGVQQKGKGRSHTEPGGLRPRPFVSESNGGRKSTHGQQLAVLHRGSETQAMAPVAQAPPPSPPSPPFRPHHDYSHGHKYRDRVDKGASYTHHNLQNLPIIHESTSHDPIDGPIVSKPPGSAQPMQLVRSNTMHRPVSRMAPLPSSTTNPNNSHPGAELGNSALSLGQHLPRSFSGEAENRQESLYSETIETRTATDSETDTTPHGEDQEQDQNHNGVTHGRQEDSAPRQPQVSIGTRSVSTDSEFQLDSGLSNIYNNLSGSKLAASSGVHDLRELEISYTSGVQHAANRGSGTEDPTDSTTNKLHEETSLLPGPENGKLRIQRTATDMLMREDRNIDVSGFTPLIGADGVNSPDYPLAEASGNARDGHASRKALAEGPGASHSKEVSGVGGEMQSSSSVSGSVVSNSGGEDSEYSVEQPGGVSSYRRPYAETVIGSPKLSTAQIAPAEDKGKENDGDLIDLSEG